MLTGIKVLSHGVVPKNLKAFHREASHRTWEAIGKYFHENMRDKRFSREHAREAGYKPRKGETAPPNSKEHRQSYYYRKLKRHQAIGYDRPGAPLVFSGETRELVRTANLDVARSGLGVKIKYPGARKLNFKHPKSEIVMSDEFTRITDREAKELSRLFDEWLGEEYAKLDRKN
jgi:hypothetical protein